ncbi:MAG: PAS-domain containing protein, partial [Pseudomonadota bacterium]
MSFDYVHMFREPVVLVRVRPGDRSLSLVTANAAFQDLIGAPLLNPFLDRVRGSLTDAAALFLGDGVQTDPFDLTLDRPGEAPLRVTLSPVVSAEAAGDSLVCCTLRAHADPDALADALAEARLWQDRYFASLNRYVSAFQAYSEPLAMFDSARRVQVWNQAFAQSVAKDPTAVRQGMTADEILDLPAADGITGQARRCLVPSDRDTADLSAVDIVSAGGSHCRLVHRKTTLGDFLVIGLDATALVAERENAQKERSRLIAAINASADPVVIYDEALRLITWNAAYAELNLCPADADLEGMHLQDVLMNAAASGRYPEAIGREAAWVDEILSAANQHLPWEDVVLQGDRHFRLSRSRSRDGDFVAIFMNTTDFVRQKRAAQAANDRLIAALNAYPSPFAIFDPDYRLVVWNVAYRKSMTDDPDGLSAGMPAADVVHMALEAGKLVSHSAASSYQVSPFNAPRAAEIPSEDIELEGDQHQRVLRTRAENGDVMLLRIDTTELVRQRRTLEATQKRLISAINAYPDPFVIYDKDLKLVIWNPAFARSMSNEPETIKAGTSLKDLFLIAARAGKIQEAIGREEAWVEDFYAPDMLTPGVVDFAFS